MIKKRSRLTVAFIRSIDRPGRFGDGHGSHGLSIVARDRADGGLRLFWQQRISINGKKVPIGLGSYPLISLKEARILATSNARLISQGLDPRQSKRIIPTLADAIAQYVRDRTPHWETSGEKAAERNAYLWTLTTRFCAPILNKKVCDVTTDDVTDILRDIWTKKMSTAQKVRSHLSQVFDWAMQRQYMTHNPASRRALRSLGTQPRSQKHPAAPYDDLGGYLAQVRDSGAWWSIRYCILLLAFTANRSGEIRDATWDEVDWEKQTIPIPISRMKDRKYRTEPFVVPLVWQAMEILRFAYSKRQDNRIFPAKFSGEFLDKGALNELLRLLAMPFVPHGLRSTFRTWVSDERRPDSDLAERCLAHVVGKPSARPYDHADYLEPRRELLQAYADYLTPMIGPMISPRDSDAGTTTPTSRKHAVTPNRKRGGKTKVAPKAEKAKGKVFPKAETPKPPSRPVLTPEDRRRKRKDSTAAYKQRIKDTGRCLDCQAPARPGKTRCQACADKKRDEDRIRRARKREAVQQQRN